MSTLICYIITHNYIYSIKEYFLIHIVLQPPSYIQISIYKKASSQKSSVCAHNPSFLHTRTQTYIQAQNYHRCFTPIVPPPHRSPTDSPNIQPFTNNTSFTPIVPRPTGHLPTRPTSSHLQIILASHLSTHFPLTHVPIQQLTFYRISVQMLSFPMCNRRHAQVKFQKGIQSSKC